MGIGVFGSRVARVAYDTPLIQVLELFLRKGISAVPIVDHKDEVLDIYEKYDVLALAREGVQHDLESSVGEAVRLRSSNDLLRVHTCTLSDTLHSLLDTIRKSKVHRFVIIDDDAPSSAGGPTFGSRRLSGILTLSDLLKWIIKPPHEKPVEPEHIAQDKPDEPMLVDTDTQTKEMDAR
jgi:CBS domain-containing protein